jgi:hypothetical protein
MIERAAALVAADPPVDDDGHRFMPFGQIIAAFGVASFAALAALVVMFRPLVAKLAGLW